jgi:hypothetical protein
MSRDTLIAQLATYFTRRPNVWIDGRELARIGGAYAWRSRVSDLRRPPFRLQIQNRQRRVRTNGRSVVVSEYRLVADQQELPLSAVDTARGNQR